jgi:hypothetical protein
MRTVSEIAGEIEGLAAEAEVILPASNFSPTWGVRDWLQMAGLYPTAEGAAAMQDPEERAAARRHLQEALPDLAPADLLAVCAVALSLR